MQGPKGWFVSPIRIVELFANIRKTLVSFFSIVMFVALGVGIYLGILWVSPALQTAADQAFNEGSYHNVQIQFPYGLTDDDIAKLKTLEGVSEVEPSRQSFQTAIYDSQKKTVKVHAMGERIDVLSVVDGTLPQKADEIAIYATCAKTYGIALGDEVSFEKDASSQDDADGMAYLTGSTFKVTALVFSPEYVATQRDMYGISNSISGSVDILAWVMPAAFDPAAFQDAYPVVNVRCTSLDGLGTFGAEYREKSSPIVERVRELGDGLADTRYDSLHDTAQAKVADGEKRLDEGKQQVSDGEKRLDEGKQQVSDGEKQLDEGRIELETKRADGERELDEAYDLLMHYESLRAEAEKQLADARSIVSEAEEALADFDEAKGLVERYISEAAAFKADVDAMLASGGISREEYEAALDRYAADITAALQPYAGQLGITIPTITHESFSEALESIRSLLAYAETIITVTFDGETMTVAQVRARLNAARWQLANAEAEYDDKVAQLEDGWAQYYAGKAELEAEVADAEWQLEEGAQQLEEAKKKVEEGTQQLEEAKKKVEEGTQQLEEAKKGAAALKPYAWTVTGRLDNVGAANVTVFSKVTTNLSMTMALLFVVVGLLVTYSAISRIVNDQITQVGTKKALGMRVGEVASLYLMYAGVAVFLGSVVGTILSVVVVESIIAGALGTNFTFGAFPPHYDLLTFAVITLAELVLVLGATWFACRSILRRNAVDLLQGETPPTGKMRFYERWGIWRRLPLFTQTVVNNCVNDKRRVFSTIVGVVGCAALIVTAITLNNDVMKSYDLQYRDVYGFSAIAYADPAVEGALDKVQGVFADAGETSAQAFRKTMLISLPDGGGSAALNVIVPTDEKAFKQVYHANPLTGGEVDLTAEGVWMTQAYHDHLGAQVGDKIVVEAGDGKRHELPILGFYQFYLTYHEVIMGRDCYEREFGTELAPNVVLADAKDVLSEARLAKLTAIKGFDTLADDKTYQYGNFATFSSVSYAVVAIYLVLSTLMAFVVLLNLNVMCVEEKKRELIVLMICGFSIKDTKRYVYQDTIVLTAIGIVLGVIVGNAMGAVTIAAMEPATASFLKAIDPMAVAIGVVGSAVLAAIMCVLSLRRIPRFDLTDINRF